MALEPTLWDEGSRMTAQAWRTAADTAAELDVAALDAPDPGADYALVAAAIDYLQAHYRTQPGLDELAAQLHISPFHLQRVFKRWAGISPKRFVQYLTVEHAKQALAASTPLLQASLESGLSGPGRLHDLFVSVEAVTPGEYKSGGAGLTIRYGLHEGPFGATLLAVTERGVCGLAFVDGDATRAVADLQRHWPAARLIEDPAATAPLHARIFAPPHAVIGAEAGAGAGAAVAATEPIPLLLKGTNFQIRVWEALLRVAQGELTTYGGVAAALGEPSAARAVGAAVGANAIAFLIPCHRVIRSSGVVEGYRWGSTRKRALLGWEAAQRAQAAA